VWEEGLVSECVDRLSHVFLHVGVADQGVCKLHILHNGSIRSKVLIITSLMLKLFTMKVLIMCCSSRRFRSRLIFLI
jgi:hypothetical protein